VCECEEDPEPVYEEECTTLASICFPKEVACETDADCAEGFVCFDIGMGDTDSGGDCLCPGCACPDCPPGEECEDCECPPCDCGDDEDFEPEAELVCIPAGWDEADYVGGDGSGGGYEATVDTAKGQAGHDDDTIGPEAPTGEGDPNGSAAAENEESADSAEDSSGCTASSTANTTTAAMLFFLLFGLVLVRTRRSDLS